MNKTEELDAQTRILDAAEQAFADSGFAGARVNAIAKAADINKAMLYYYFDSKEGLHDAVMERVFGQVVDVLEAHIEQHETADITGFIRGYRGVLRSHPNVARLMMRDLADGGHNIARVLGPKVQRIVGSMGPALFKGQQEGTINPDLNPLIATPVLLAPFILFAIVSPTVSAVSGLPVEMLTGPFDQTAEEILLRGLLARREP